MIGKVKGLVNKALRLRQPDESLVDLAKRLWMLYHMIRSGGSKIKPQDIRAVTQLLKSGRIAYGPVVHQLESDFARLYGIRGAVASSSGTAAVHVALAMVGIEPGDEVIVPPITDMGTVLPILALNAIPVFADVDPETWTLSPQAVASQITPRTRAIIAVHLFGNPCDLDGLRAAAGNSRIRIIEDCAQAHWATYKGRPIGTIGNAGAFSLQWTKHITSCEGGITISRNPETLEIGGLFVDKGWRRGASAGARQYPIFGLNYRLSEMQAAMARSQLVRVPEIVDRRNENARAFIEQLSDLGSLRFQKVLDGCRHAYWQLALTVDPSAPFTADALVAALGRRKLGGSAHYIGRPLYMCSAPLLNHHVFGSSNLPFGLVPARSELDYGDVHVPVAEAVLNRLVILPMVGEHFTIKMVRALAKEVRTVIEDLSNPGRMQNKPNAKYRLGLVGCGSISKSHLDAVRLIPQIMVTAVADVNEEATKTVASLFGAPAQYRDYNQMLASEQLDIVLTCVWPGLHSEVVTVAARHGIRAVLCEKPVASNLGEAKGMLEAVSRSGTVLVIGHQHNFNPHLVRARELLASGEIGRIQHVWAHCRSSLINNGSHVIDGLLYMLGRPAVEWVLGQVHRTKGTFDRDQPVEDGSIGLIALENGTRINLEMGETAVQEIGWQFTGELGKIDVALNRITVVGKTHPKATTQTMQVGIGMQAQLEELIACLNDPSRSHRSIGQYGYASLEVLIGLLESARLGQVVHMPVTQMGYPLELAPAGSPAKDAVAR